MDPGIARGTGEVTARFENSTLRVQPQGSTAAEFAMVFTVDAN